MPEATDALLAGVEAALADLKAVNSVTIDVHELSNVMDYLIICTGTSNRHVKSLAENVVKMAKESGQPPLGVEGQDAGEWVLVDLGDVVVHVMLPATRDFYDLERLWTTVAPAPGSPSGHSSTGADASAGPGGDAAVD